MDDILKTHEGEFYLHPESGKVRKRQPAGGSGGGVTSYADAEASEAEAVAYFDLMKERKAAEAEAMKDRHEEAKTTLAKTREEEAKAAADDLDAQEQAAKDPAAINPDAGTHHGEAKPLPLGAS
jgi:hypothetical protein